MGLAPPGMRFSWPALFLSPLAVPAIVTVLMLAQSERPVPVDQTLGFFALLSVFTGGCTVFALLPALFLTSRVRPLTGRLTAGVGAAPGAMIYGPFSWVMWKSGGTDSGPPDAAYGGWMLNDMGGAMAAGAAFPAAGAVTAMVYWALVRKRPPGARSGAAD